MNKDKLEYTKELIHCWVDSWGVDNVYVAFSGGKDSTVLLHIARHLYPGMTAVFANTGLEFPEIVSFVKSHPNITTIRPAIPFHKVIQKYGYPVVSKSVSMAISRYRNTKRQDQRDYRLNGRIVNGVKHTAGTIPKKYHHMIDAPFKISEACCQHLKKNPFKKYEKLTGKKPMIGIMAGDSRIRKADISSRGCNVYDVKAPQSRPLAHWMEEDIYSYLDTFNVPISSVYNMGYDRTGCVFCMYGLQQEQKNTGSNRFQKMRITHPKLYKYCMEKLGIKEVLEFMDISYK